MKRRELITLLGGAAAAWPLVARAQRPERMRLIGALTGLADEPFARARATVFIKELQELGWIDGRNMRVDYRWGGGDADIIRRQAIELVALAPDVILATGGPAKGSATKVSIPTISACAASGSLSTRDRVHAWSVGKSRCPVLTAAAAIQSPAIRSGANPPATPKLMMPEAPRLAADSRAAARHSP
jgi:hypothetical protein